MSSTTTPAIAAVRDAAWANRWFVERDRLDDPGRLFEAHKDGNCVTVRFDRRGGITHATYNLNSAQGQDKRATVIGWLRASRMPGLGWRTLTEDRNRGRCTTMSDTSDPPASVAEDGSYTALEQRLTAIEPIATATVTSYAAPLQIEGKLTDGSLYLFRARHGTATLSIAQPGGNVMARDTPTERIPCAFIELASTTNRISALVRTLLVKHGLRGYSELLPNGNTEPITSSFMRRDYSGPRTHRVWTDGGAVDLTLGFTDGQGRHIIDVHVNPHREPTTDDDDADGTWRMEHTDDGFRLICQPLQPLPNTNPA